MSAFSPAGINDYHLNPLDILIKVYRMSGELGVKVKEQTLGNLPFPGVNQMLTFLYCYKSWTYLTNIHSHSNKLFKLTCSTRPSLASSPVQSSSRGGGGGLKPPR